MRLSANIAAMMLIILCFYAQSAEAGGLNIPWNQNSISYNQLQNIMATNPGINQFNIQFPNGANWNVTPSQLQSLYQSYKQQAQDIGYTITNPNLNFSSVDNVMNAIPINDSLANMQMAVEPMVRELRYEQLHLSDEIPDWLKAALVWMVNLLSEIYDWIMQAIGPYLPNWR